MATPELTSGLLAPMDRAVEVLRDNLAAFIALAQSEIGAAPVLQTPRDVDIMLGDHPDVVPGRLVTIRVLDADHRPGPTLSLGEGRGETRFKVRVYSLAAGRVAVGGVTDQTILPTLERIGAAVASAAVGALEQGLRVSGQIWNPRVSRARPLQSPPLRRVNNVLVKCYEIEVSCRVRHRLSDGLPLPS